jgi:hypothetical protein
MGSDGDFVVTLARVKPDTLRMRLRVRDEVPACNVDTTTAKPRRSPSDCPFSKGAMTTSLRMRLRVEPAMTRGDVPPLGGGGEADKDEIAGQARNDAGWRSRQRWWINIRS